MRLKTAAPLFFIAWYALSAAALSASWYGTCVDVVDGDTIIVLREEKRVRIRLSVADAPERGQNGYAEAKKFVSEKTFGRRVLVREIGSAAHDRVEAAVMVDGMVVNQELVKQGYGMVSAPHCRDGSLSMWLFFQQYAQSMGLGIWARPDPLPPWTYRDLEKAARDALRYGHFDATAPFRGNGGSRIFHKSSCRHFMAKGNIASFATREHALAGGFRPCRRCAP